ncbi:MAG: hypothetical protein U0556_10030 [Dehalococcoidia bacterium]
MSALESALAAEPELTIAVGGQQWHLSAAVLNALGHPAAVRTGYRPASRELLLVPTTPGPVAKRLGLLHGSRCRLAAAGLGRIGVPPLRVADAPCQRRATALIVDLSDAIEEQRDAS